MDRIRNIKRIVKGINAVDGAGVKLVRVFGNYDTKDFDPFLMLDAFDSSNPNDYSKGFPWHPHRGIETITYLIEGDIEHGDSLGNKGSILDGQCQWMTAGSGIIHQEMPRPAKRMLGLQTWLNLPAKDKMTEPAYNQINDIPSINEGNNIIRVISGSYKDTKGAFEGKFVKPTYLDISMEPNSEWSFEVDTDNTLFIYIFAGKALFGSDEKEVSEKHAVLFEKGNKFVARTTDSNIRFVLLTAKPLNEPIAWGGPIVMNTREELEQAFDDLENGTFIR